MDFWKKYISSFWIIGIIALVNIIIVGTHNISSFNLTVGMVTSFFSSILAFSLMNIWFNQNRFGLTIFVVFHLIASLIFFLFFQNHLHNYVLEDSGLFFYYPIVGVFLLTFFASGLAALNKSQQYFWKYNANIASSFGNSLFFSFLITIGILLILFSIDLLFWNNIYKGGFGVKIYLSISSLTFFLTFGYYFFKNFELKNYFINEQSGQQKSIDTKSFLKLYFPLILVLLIFLTINILLMIQKGQLQAGTGIFLLAYLILWLGYYVLDFPGNNKLNIIFWLIAMGLGGILIYGTYTRIGFHGWSIARYGSIIFGGLIIILGLSQILFKNIKIFSVLVYITLFFAFFSPLNGLNISQKDQLGRIEDILKKEGILLNGNLVETQKKLTNEKKADMLLRLQNYIYNYGSKGLLPWLKTGDAASKGDAINDFSEQTGIKRGFESYKTQETEITSVSRPYDIFKNYNFDSSDYWNVRGYETAFRFKANLENPSIKYDSNSIRLLGNSIRIYYNNIIYTLDLNDYLESIIQVRDENNIIPSYSLSVGEYYFTIVFSNLQINTNKNIIDTIDAMVFVKKD